MNLLDAARLLRQEKNAPMTIIEAAERLHIHPTSLSNLVKAGDLISGQKVKGRWEIEESEVARLLATRYEIRGECMTLKQRERQAQKIVDEWNELFKVGQRVVVREDFKKIGTITQTRSAARVMCGDAVVWCDGISGAYSLSHVTAIEA